MREGLTGAARMLAAVLGRWLDTIRHAQTEPDLLGFVSLAFGTPYGGHMNAEGWCEYKGSYRGEKRIHAPLFRYSTDKGETWTEYKGAALASLVRSILGTEPQADLFAGARAAAPERVA